MKVRLAFAAAVLLAACGDEVPTSPAPSLLVLPGDNSPPTVEIVTPTEGQLFPLTSVAGAPVALSADLTDPDPGDVHTCAIDWEGATSDGVVAEADGSGTCTGNYVYPAPGVYTIQVTVADPLGESAVDSVMIVVYDPAGGFVTGGGWVIAAPGSYPANAAATGKATFGFVAKYKKGAQVPTGNTEFQFHAVGMNFHSADYQWLVVAGRRAQYRGTGTVNGAGSYQFLLTAIDGNGPGGDGVDRFRMKVWGDAGVVFDNQQGAADGDDPVTALSGGNIVIHK